MSFPPLPARRGRRPEGLHSVVADDHDREPVDDDDGREHDREPRLTGAREPRGCDEQKDRSDHVATLAAQSIVRFRCDDERPEHDQRACRTGGEDDLPDPIEADLPTPVRDRGDPEELDDEADRQCRHSHDLHSLHCLLACATFSPSWLCYIAFMANVNSPSRRETTARPPRPRRADNEGTTCRPRPGPRWSRSSKQVATSSKPTGSTDSPCSRSRRASVSARPRCTSGSGTGTTY